MSKKLLTRRTGQKGLTQKQEKFAQKYLILGNARAAAKAAGYRGGDQAVIGWENLRKPHVVKRIEELRRERSERTQVTSDRLVNELSKIAFCNIKEIQDKGTKASSLRRFLKTLTAEEAACISGLTETTYKLKSGTRKKTTRMTFWSKEKALEMLCRIQGLFIDKLHVVDKTPPKNMLKIDDMGLTLEQRKELLNKHREIHSGRKQIESKVIDVDAEETDIE